MTQVRGKPAAVIKAISICLFCALWYKRQMEVRFGYVACACCSSACEELERGCRVKTCICGGHGGGPEGD